MRKTVLFFALLFALAAIARLAHSGILWAEEGLPLAAAREMLGGRALYSGIWFDKPPLLVLTYLLWGAQAGAILRIAGALYCTLASWIAYSFARDLWSEREGYWAAALLAFFLTFDIPAAIMPLASDMLMLAPHLAAVWMASRGRAVRSGALAGIAFLVNAKGVLVLAACALWLTGDEKAGTDTFSATGNRAVSAERRGGKGCLSPFFRLLLGFSMPCVLVALWLWQQGALLACYEEVWKWGRLYAAGTFVASPLANGVQRTLNWAGFHAAILVAAALGFKSEKQRWKFAAWALLSLAAVTAGERFFARYFLQLLPVAVMASAAAMRPAQARKREAIVLILLLVPLVRFGPEYIQLMMWGPAPWRDVAMDQDSRAAARKAVALTSPQDTIQVWGFRPEVYVYTNRHCASRFLDSQPLTGVPADRHLTDSTPVAAELAKANRAELALSRPTLILDGLGLYNPNLAITKYPDLEAWLSNYRQVGRTGTFIIYKRVAPETGSESIDPVFRKRGVVRTVDLQVEQDLSLKWGYLGRYGRDHERIGLAR